MLDPDLFYHLGTVRQKELIERGQQSASARLEHREQRGKSIMLDPYELQELGRERQRALIAWRKDQRGRNRFLNHLPLLEPVPHRVMNMMISKLRAFSLACAAVLTSATRSRREIR